MYRRSSRLMLFPLPMGRFFSSQTSSTANVRPAINAGLSVSRVGGAAQTSIIKKLGGGVSLALAQYRELAAFAQFASDLDEATRRQLERGQRVMEVLKQKQYVPMDVASQAVSLYAVDRGYLDDLALTQVGPFEDALQSHMRANQADLMNAINEGPVLSDDIDEKLKNALDDFKANHSW